MTRRSNNRTRPRPRLAAATVAVCVALVGALFSTATASPSVATAGRISAHLTKRSFPTSQSGSVRLVYAFSAVSTRFAYALSRKAGGTWVSVRSVAKRGTFRGVHSLTIKQVFGTKPLSAGQYRLKVSAAANSVTLGFTMTKPSSPPTSTKPLAGAWRATTLTGPVTGNGAGGSVTATGFGFAVLPDQATVSGFSFAYEYSGIAKPGYSCSGSGSSAVVNATSPIANGQFYTPGATGAWTGAAAGTFHGTFDSPTLAHGTAQMSLFVTGPGCFLNGTSYTGTFSWTATRR